MTQCIALLRGINVGRAKRIAMGELRQLIEGLGLIDVRTLLNSGNVVFQASKPNRGKVASAIESAIQSHFGLPVPVIVHTTSELDTIIAENPLPQAARDPSKFLVAFVSTASTLNKATQLLEERWAPDALAIGRRAAYLWCANGIIESRLMQSLARTTGEAVTTRNWTTVLKLQVAAGASRKAG